MIEQNKRLIWILIIVILLLLIPFTAMQFTSEVNWTQFDFIVAGSLLFTTGITCELVMRKVKKLKYRVAICLSILAALLIVWIELAVGIFGTPIGGN